jgi:hypothetical protein
MEALYTSGEEMKLSLEIIQLLRIDVNSDVEFFLHPHNYDIYEIIKK